MAGVVLSYALKDDAELVRRLGGLADLDLDKLVYNIGQLFESSTDERLDSEKAGPDGEPWAEWSEAYAVTRGSQHSLLIGGGDENLRESIRNLSAGLEARVGSELLYAAIHHFGGAEVGSNIPARPYLGVSPQDEADIYDLVADAVMEALQ